MATKKDATLGERVARSEAKAASKGMTKIHPLVPKCCREKALEYCAKLREEYEKTGKC